MKWTKENVDALRYLHGRGYSITRISNELGITRGKAAGKLHRLGLIGNYTSTERAPKRPRPGRPIPVSQSWDGKVFEPYANRKLRLAKERQK